MPQFARYVGVDYSGAGAPTESLPGLRVCMATPARRAVEVRPPTSTRRHWTRRGLAEWLVERLRDGPPTLVGIDHAFSFPLRYFEAHRLPRNWHAFLDDFCAHWPTDEDGVRVEMVRCGVIGHGAARGGDARWRRVVEECCRAKSVFHFDVEGSVAKSTHAGLPWLRRIRRACGEGVHFWPFDGWSPPPGRSVIAEVYPALWSKLVPRGEKNPHLHDAWSVATWMRDADRADELEGVFHPPLTPSQHAVAACEGWILGVSEAVP